MASSPTLMQPVLRVAARPAEPQAVAELLPLLYRQMRALAGPRRDLDDLVQAAAERALRALPGFEARSALSTWTWGIAYRTLVDHERWWMRWRRRFSFAGDVEAADPTPGCDGEQALAEVRRARALYRALDRLPAAKRAVIVLHDLEGHSPAIVAQIVGAPENTVRSRLRDARKRLLVLLSAEPAFSVEGEP